MREDDTSPEASRRHVIRWRFRTAAHVSALVAVAGLALLASRAGVVIALAVAFVGIAAVTFVRARYDARRRPRDLADLSRAGPLLSPQARRRALRQLTATYRPGEPLIDPELERLRVELEALPSRD